MYLSVFPSFFECNNPNFNNISKKTLVGLDCLILYYLTKWDQFDIIKMSDVVVKNVDNACETAEEFTKVFYKQVDNIRHLTSKLYLETGLLVWNGNGIKGNDKIQKFLMDLPASNHTLKTLDAQPLSEVLVSNKLTYLIQACGDVIYQNDDVKKPFQQTFLIVAVDGKWKIASDCFRLQVPYNS